MPINKDLLFKLQLYIDDNYIEKISARPEKYEIKESLCKEAFLVESPEVSRKQEDLIGQIEETFSQMLLRLIDEKDMTGNLDF